MNKFLNITFALLLFSAVASTKASAQTKSYYYYPSSNVYFDLTEKQYVFYDAGNWSTAKNLPSGIILEKGSPRVTVYHAGNDVWANNAGHVMKYKNYKGKKDKDEDKIKIKEKIKDKDN